MPDYVENSGYRTTSIAMACVFGVLGALVAAMPDHQVVGFVVVLTVALAAGTLFRVGVRRRGWFTDRPLR